MTMCNVKEVNVAIYPQKTVTFYSLQLYYFDLISQLSSQPCLQLHQEAVFSEKALMNPLYGTKWPAPTDRC